MDKTIGVIILFVMFIPWVLLVINHFSPKNKWFCKHMGWHTTPERQGFDGCSFTGTCSRCGEYVLQDGQGNWF